jgi:hypothetical protein
MKNITSGLFLFLFISAYSQDLGEYKKGVFSAHKGNLPYRILYPLSFDSTATYPLLIF